MIPFTIMAIFSIIVLWKINSRKITLNIENTQAIQLAITLISTDIIFIVTKILILFYVLSTNSEPNRGIYSLSYFLISIFNLSYSYFYFLIFLIFNKTYRKKFILYFKLICKNTSVVVPIQ